MIDDDFTIKIILVYVIYTKYFSAVQLLILSEMCSVNTEVGRDLELKIRLLPREILLMKT